MKDLSFLKKISNSDNFLGLSKETQALYFHLACNADSAGIVSIDSLNNFGMDSFKIGYSLRILCESGFIYGNINDKNEFKNWVFMLNLNN